MPAELDELERRIMQLEIEREALRKEKDKASQGTARQAREGAGRSEGRARTALRALAAGEGGDSAIAQAEGGARSAARSKSSARNAPATTPRRQSSSTAAVPQLEKQIRDEEARLAALQKDQRMLKEEVDEEDIAEVVSKWTHIPVSRMMEGEVQKLLHMEERLHQRVIGQDEAINAVANAIRRARAGLQDPQPAARQLHVPRPDRRRQDRAGARARRVPVRRRAGDDPDRHVRVPGEAHRLADDRRASRIRGLRRGRPADRGGPAPAVRRGPASTRSRRRIPKC